MRPPRRRRTTRKYVPPYELNELPVEALTAIAKDLIARRVLREASGGDISGAEWERMFASAIGGEWHNSVNGLDDVRLNDCAWAVKSVKKDRPDRQRRLRLICGRNSIHYSYGITDPTKLDPSDIGARVLEIWNDRVAEALSSYRELRTVVFIRSDDLERIVLFEMPTMTYDAEQFEWKWNNRKNLVGLKDGKNCFTWQPHGAQFTIHVEVPEVRHLVRISIPSDVVSIRRDDLLDLIDFREHWIEYRRLGPEDQDGTI
ncbi:MAG: hypothetical protein KatS3mg015_1242 [Fimbriimonadales bacterium]|nr:MAG: hypothetical protein KatS3mg015_1242 [Fimbriimonadales bacterium]